MKAKVFLGGTCNESNWRLELTSCLYHLKIDYFDPVVDDWNEEALKKEEIEKLKCDYFVYTLTPKMSGVYTIAELVNSAHLKPSRTIFLIIEKDEDLLFTEGQKRSIDAVRKLVEELGVKIVPNVFECAKYLYEIIT